MLVFHRSFEATRHAFPEDIPGRPATFVEFGKSLSVKRLLWALGNDLSPFSVWSATNARAKKTWVWTLDSSFLKFRIKVDVQFAYLINCAHRNHWKSRVDQTYLSTTAELFCFFTQILLHLDSNSDFHSISGTVAKVHARSIVHVAIVQTQIKW